MRKLTFTFLLFLGVITPIDNGFPYIVSDQKKAVEEKVEIEDLDLEQIEKMDESEFFKEDRLFWEEALPEASKEDRAILDAHRVIDPDGEGEDLESDIIYQGTKRSLLQWSKIDPVEWLDYIRWRNEQSLKDGIPDWEIRLRDIRLTETVGKFIDCVGECRVYRDEGYSTAEFLSKVVEKDEVATQEDSYGYIYLMDGSLVRISPNTSVIFKEINVSNEEIFYNIRVNYGNIVWLPRLRDEFIAVNKRETDPLFLPLTMTDANPVPLKYKFDPKDLLASLYRPKTIYTHYLRVNDLLKKNNDAARELKTTVFLATPNLTMVGENPYFEVISLLAGKTYIQGRNYKRYVPGSTFDTKLTVSFRGYENRESKELASGIWYEMEPRGRSIAEVVKKPVEFGFNEFLMSRIPSVMMARELYFEQFTVPLLKRVHTQRSLAGLGYRLWNSNQSPTDLTDRLAFVTEYSRREETTGLIMSGKFRAKMQSKGEKFVNETYDSSYFGRAMTAYSTSDNDAKMDREESAKLNSTRKRFWKYVKNRRKN